MTAQTAKRVFLKTFGCQMNVYDSERMMEALSGNGYQPTDDVGDADLVILNTCHIREKAAEKVYSDLGRIREVKEARQARGRQTILAVTGCVAQAEGAEIVRRQSAVDLVVGPQSYHRIGDLIARAKAGKRAIVETEFNDNEKFLELPAKRRVSSPSAFLTVQEGCDKFCSFCVVPYTRGLEYSRPVDEILQEARQLVEAGAREITLLGQNVNAYRGRGGSGRTTNLATLIREIAKIDGLARIRYTTSHPNDVDDDLIAAHADVAQLMPFLHLPVQSGSDKILDRMNRRHTAADYRKTIRKLREARPGIAFSSDFITGHPGESDDDFEMTMRLVEEIGFGQAFSFKYSPRPGTPAAANPDQIDGEVKAKRLERLQALLLHQQTAFNQAAIGSVLPVLFERISREPGIITGRTPHMQIIHVEADAELVGQIHDCLVTDARPMSLAGRLQVVTGRT